MQVLSALKLKAFHLAGMTGSFKHAAHLLSISPSAVSARVRSLESDLGVRLFKRGIRQLSLTEAGAARFRVGVKGWVQAQRQFAAAFGAKRAVDLRALLHAVAATDLASAAGRRGGVIPGPG